MLVLITVASACLGGTPAHADVSEANAANLQEGDNRSDARQNGRARSGDAVGGQVVGIVSSGDARVEATNRSEDVRITTGDATAVNQRASFVGLEVSTSTAVLADIRAARALNLQEGDNVLRSSQLAEAVSGDAVGGQVAGLVTDGRADVRLHNTSRDVDLSTGDATVRNLERLFVGLRISQAQTITPDPDPDPGPEPDPDPDPDLDLDPGIQCTAVADDLDPPVYEVFVTCDAPITSFVFFSPAENDFQPHNTPDGYTCITTTESISCEADGEGDTTVSAVVSTSPPLEPGDVIEILVNETTSLSAEIE